MHDLHGTLPRIPACRQSYGYQHVSHPSCYPRFRFCGPMTCVPTQRTPARTPGGRGERLANSDPLPAYNASKRYLSMFTRELAVRSRGSGIDVFAAHPGECRGCGLGADWVRTACKMGADWVRP